jgi:hypothetical protein
MQKLIFVINRLVLDVSVTPRLMRTQ